MIDDDKAWEFICAICIIIAVIAVGFILLGGITGALVYFLA